MTSDMPRPAPGSHDRSRPSGSLETSAANLFEAMAAARDAEERGTGRAALDGFYRTLMSGTLLFPVPPDHGEEAKAALASAIDDSDEVEISVMLARDGDGEPVSVCFASNGALAAWAPRGTASLPLPARVAVANLASAGLPAIMDPAGPIPYRFENDRAPCAGRRPPARLGRAALRSRRARIGPPAAARVVCARPRAVARGRARRLAGRRGVSRRLGVGRTRAAPARPRR